MPIRVAIVEDSREVKEGLAWLIRNSPDFECVAVCGSGEEALATLPNLKPDVVLMDIGLPGMSGIACIGPLKKFCPDVQIAMLTVFEDEEQIFRSLSAGATGYLLKSTTPAKIIEGLQDLHAGGSPISSQIARKLLTAFVDRPESPRSGSPKPHEALDNPSRASLTGRERQILELLAKGHRYKEVADELEISIHTVRTFIRRMYEKLHVHSRTEALLKVAGK